MEKRTLHQVARSFCHWLYMKGSELAKTTSLMISVLKWSSGKTQKPGSRPNLHKQALEVTKIGCTPRGSCNRTRLLEELLRRFSNSRCFLEGFLEGAL